MNSSAYNALSQDDREMLAGLRGKLAIAVNEYNFARQQAVACKKSGYGKAWSYWMRASKEWKQHLKGRVADLHNALYCCGLTNVKPKAA